MKVYLPNCKIPIRLVPERKRISWHRRGVKLIINAEHRDHVLAIKSSLEGTS